MILNVTATLTCGLSILFLTLSWSVIQQRGLSGVSLGDRGEKILERKIRAQGNLVEYGPMFVLLIAMAEIRVGPSIALWVLATAFLIARLLHGIGLSFFNHSPKFRNLGILITFLTFIVAIITNLVIIGISA